MAYSSWMQSAAKMKWTTANWKLLEPFQIFSKETVHHMVHDTYYKASLNEPRGSAEKTYYVGKNHCMTGLQFNWIRFDQTRKYDVTCIK